MKKGILRFHKIINALIIKPILVVSIIFWSWIFLYGGQNLIETILAVGKKGVEKGSMINEIYIFLFMIFLAIAFIKLSWDGIRFQPGKTAGISIKSSKSDPVEMGNG